MNSILVSQCMAEVCKSGRLKQKKKPQKWLSALVAQCGWENVPEQGLPKHTPWQLAGVELRTFSWQSIQEEKKHLEFSSQDLVTLFHKAKLTLRHLYWACILLLLLFWKNHPGFCWNYHHGPLCCARLTLFQGHTEMPSPPSVMWHMTLLNST